MFIKPPLTQNTDLFKSELNKQSTLPSNTEISKLCLQIQVRKPLLAARF